MLGLPVSIRPYFLFPELSTFSSRTQRPFRPVRAEETYIVVRSFSFDSESETDTETAACTGCVSEPKMKQIIISVQASLQNTDDLRVPRELLLKKRNALRGV